MSRLIYIANQRLPTEKAHGIQISKMCEAFADSGISVELVVPTRQNGNPQKVFEYYGIRRNFLATTVPSPDFYWPGVLDRVAFFIKQWMAAMRLVHTAMRRNADIIYSRDEFSIFLASFYSRRPLLVFEAHTFSARRKVYYRRFKRAGVKIVAISRGVRDAFVACGYNSEKVCIAHDGVDIQQFVVVKTKEECRNLLTLPQDKKLVLYTGHLYAWKGANVLLEAVRNFQEARDIVFVFVGGTGPDITDFKHRVKVMELNNVMIVGHVPHSMVPLYLRAADIVVLPNSGREAISQLYTSPLKMFEYMASGKPIIASDLPSIREVLTEGVAFFFRPDDPKDLARIIEEVASNASEAEKRSRQARQSVERYSWQMRASRITKFLGI